MTEIDERGNDAQKTVSPTPMDTNITTSKEPRGPNLSSKSDDSSSSIQLDMVSFRICQVIVPVTLCAIYTVILIRILEWDTGRSANIIDHTWKRLGLGVNQDLAFSKTLLNNTIIVGVFVLLIVIVSLVILFVFYMEWHSCLSYYFYIPSFIIMALITPVYIKGILASLNWFGVDLITIVLFTWNFVALGMVSIFNIYAKGPLFVQQFYLIHNSAILAVTIIKALPSWAPWLLLIFLVFWDLFAVLAPFGPLNLIINMAEREGVIEMPGLVYTTDIITTSQQNDQHQQQQQQEQELQPTTTGQQDNSNTSILTSGRKHLAENDISRGKVALRDELEVGRQNATTDPQEEEAEGGKENEKKRKSIQERGINIGLGDFIFYSLLIGLTARGRQMEDFYSILASLDAILLGLVLTLVILVVTRRALPALPISVALGLIVSVVTIYFVPQLSNELAREQIFI